MIQFIKNHFSKPTNMIKLFNNSMVINYVVFGYLSFV